MIRERFTSRVVLDRPRQIDVSYIEGPLRHLNNHWEFHPHEDGCLIDFLRRISSSLPQAAEADRHPVQSRRSGAWSPRSRRGHGTSRRPDRGRPRGNPQTAGDGHPDAPERRHRGRRPAPRPVGRHSAIGSAREGRGPRSKVRGCSTAASRTGRRSPSNSLLVLSARRPLTAIPGTTPGHLACPRRRRAATRWIDSRDVGRGDGPRPRAIASANPGEHHGTVALDFPHGGRRGCGAWRHWSR